MCQRLGQRQVQSSYGSLLRSSATSGSLFTPAVFAPQVGEKTRAAVAVMSSVEVGEGGLEARREGSCLPQKECALPE